jgi:hypothetical protein
MVFIYNAGWGGGFIQTNVCGEKKLITRSTANSTECSTNNLQVRKLKQNSQFPYYYTYGCITQ